MRGYYCSYKPNLKNPCYRCAYNMSGSNFDCRKGGFNRCREQRSHGLLGLLKSIIRALSRGYLFKNHCGVNGKCFLERDTFPVTSTFTYGEGDDAIHVEAQLWPGIIKLFDDGDDDTTAQK